MAESPLRSQDGNVIVCEDCGMAAADYHCDRCCRCFCAICFGEKDSELCSSCAALPDEDEEDLS